VLVAPRTRAFATLRRKTKDTQPTAKKQLRAPVRKFGSYRRGAPGSNIFPFQLLPHLAINLNQRWFQVAQALVKTLQIELLRLQHQA